MRKAVLIFVWLVLLAVAPASSSPPLFHVNQFIQKKDSVPPPPAPLPKDNNAPTAVLPPETSGDVGRPILIIVQSNGPNVRLYCADPDLSIIPPKALVDSKQQYVVGRLPKVYTLVAVTAKGDVLSEFSQGLVKVGNPPPVPPDPGPGPGPGPVPPSPTPPIPSDGFKMLIVWDRSSPKTVEQDEMNLHPGLNKYLWDKCAKGKDGKTPEYRRWDSKANVANSTETDFWKKVFARYPGKGQWYYVTNKDSYTEGELPKDVPALLETLKKYGGN